MRITHLCMASFYPDGYSYQENMLPKFHKMAGHEVSVIASLQTFDANGKTTYLERSSCYRNEYDIPVIRLDYKKPTKIYKKLKRFYGLKDALDKTKPEVLFIHGGQSLDVDIVIKYLKEHPDIVVYIDNHADFSNSATNWISKNLLHKLIWRRCLKKIEPYTKKFYGVLPARVEFLLDMYKLPKEKCELLVMGTDDELVEKSSDLKTREVIRKRYGVSEKDFLIITGGKIDLFKTQTLLLMQAVKKIQNISVKLIVFGSVAPELKKEVDGLADGNKVKYIGWVNSEESYPLFAASDLAIFPGRHSVFWEQVVGQGIPMLVKHWDGTTHVDCGGNVGFLYKDSEIEIQEKIEELVFTEKYFGMKKVAETVKKRFLYSEIAKKSIEGVDN